MPAMSNRLQADFRLLPERGDPRIMDGTVTHVWDSKAP
jgi:hypothetical protein